MTEWFWFILNSLFAAFFLYHIVTGDYEDRKWVYYFDCFAYLINMMAVLSFIWDKL